MSTAEYSHDVNAQDLEALKAIHSGQGPVFSLYLDLRSEKDDPRQRFARLLAEMEQQKKLDQAPTTYQEQWGLEAERIRRWLADRPASDALGLAVFSGKEAGLWRAYRLPAPVFDRLMVSQWPYLRPLEILLAEYPCTLVALMDAGAARLVKVCRGSAGQVGSAQAVPVTGGDGGLRLHARSVAEQVEAAWEDDAYAQLVLGGSAQALGALAQELPNSLRARLAAEIRLTPGAPLDEIAALVQAREKDWEARQEERRIQEFIAQMSVGEAAVAGLEQTLLAIRSKKVRLVLAAEDFHQAGGECPNCGFMEDGEEINCLLCGVALRPEADIVETALKHALDAGAEIDILRSPGARQALESYGHIGALLREQGVPPEKDVSNQRVLAQDGEIYPDALHDEAIEESFPASDPPSWS